jgi:26S proteasome non-ATPase regulatory subunit 9
MRTNQGDQLCRFADVAVTATGGDELARVARALQQHENSAVEVVFLRQGQPVSMQLTPRQWAGRGLLGCHLRPLGQPAR